MDESFWKDKNVVVTGGSSGIGEAVLQELSAFDCRVINLSRRTHNPSIRGKGQIQSISMDLSSEKSVVSACKKVLKSFPSIDVIFNNAGITTHDRFDQTELSTFHKTFAINFFGPLALTHTLLPALKKSQGTMIVTSTVSGLYGVPARSAYSSSKAALHAVCESIRIECSDEGIRTIIACPPYTRTALRQSGLDGKGKKISEEQYKGRLLEPREVAVKMIEAVEKGKNGLLVMDRSGRLMNWLRVLAPKILEKVMYRKLYQDFH